MKNGSSNLPNGRVPKDPTQSQTYQHYSKILKLVPTTGKHQKFAKKPTKSKKNIKRLEQTPAVLKIGSSNLPDGSVPNDPSQIQTNWHHPKIPNLVLATGKHQKSAKKTEQNLKKILKHLNKPCSIGKWVFQSTRLKRTKRRRPE